MLMSLWSERSPSATYTPDMESFEPVDGPTEPGGAPEPREMGTPPDLDRFRRVAGELVETIARLRAPGGCPWDREQTLASIKPHTLEEVHELLEAIDADDNEAICDELGDVLLQVVLDAQIAADEGRFDLNDVVENLTAKMIRRHPHVFGDETAVSADDVRRHWANVKAAEKAAAQTISSSETSGSAAADSGVNGSEPPGTAEQRVAGEPDGSLLDGIPVALPALARAVKLSKKAAGVGYDWPHRAMLLDKLQEELAELRVELTAAGDVPDLAAGIDGEVVPDADVPADVRDRIEDECGDLLFVVANIARRWGVNPEDALRRTNNKFRRRFAAIERGVAAAGGSLEDATLDQMEAYYQEEKQREKEREAKRITEHSSAAANATAANATAAKSTVLNADAANATDEVPS